jgi:hypothetical protein
VGSLDICDDQPLQYRMERSDLSARSATHSQQGHYYRGLIKYQLAVPLGRTIGRLKYGSHALWPEHTSLAPLPLTYRHDQYRYQPLRSLYHSCWTRLEATPLYGLLKLCVHLIHHDIIALGWLRDLHKDDRSDSSRTSY